MSNYRNYAPWNKTSTSSYSSGIKKESPGIPKYDLTFGRNRTDVSKKADDDKGTSRIATRYGSSYSAGYQRDSSVPGYSGRIESSRIKPVLDKKDTSHPPVTYRPIGRTGSRSRDPSPVDKSEKSSSSSSSYSYNRLYPRPYQGSASREKSDSSPATTIPKYTGRTSIGRDEIPRYTGRSSTSKDDSLSARYGRNSSREDLSSGSQKYINSRFLPKNAVEKSYTAHTRPSNIRTNETSRKNRELLSVLHAQQEQERLSRSSSRCSSVTPDETVSSLHTESKSQSPPKQVEMETITVITRATSPSPVTTQNNSYLRSRRIEIAKYVEKQITRPKTRTHTMVDKEMQSDRLDDTTRTSRFAGASRISTSPWSSILDMKFSSPNSKQKTLNKSENSGQEEEKQKEICDSPKNVSRNNSSKSLSPSSTKSEKKDIKKSSPSPPKSKIVPPKQIPNDKKQLPPQIPKCENTNKSNSLHSLQTTNKDFRKSVLNMNPDGKSKKKLGRRSNSASSAESDAADPDATDVSENLTSCKSYHTSSSKLPQKVSSDKSLQRNSRSPSSDASTSCHTSSSDDDLKTKHEKIKRKSAASSRTSIVVSSADEFSSDKSPKPPQSPRPKIDGMKSEAEAKSFLMRALAPVTNLFKVKHHGSEEKVNWMDPNSESNNEVSKNSLSDDVQNLHSFGTQNTQSVGLKPTGTGLIPAKIIIHRVESTEKPWWLDEKSGNSEQSSLQDDNPNKPSLKHVDSGEVCWWNQELDDKSEISRQDQSSSPKQTSKQENSTIKPLLRRVESGEIAWWNQMSDEKSSGQDLSRSPKQMSHQENLKKPLIKHVESGEIPWWLDENAEIPEGVQTYPNWVREDGTTEDGRIIYKIRKNDSGDTSWWLSNSDKTDSNQTKPSNIMDSEYLDKHKIRHIDSGERSWWLNSSENISEMVQATEGSNQNQAKYAIRHQDSNEKAWWLQQNTSEQNRDSEYEFDQEQVPLGDRASPEGLEMPKEDEHRLSPYDNVRTNQRAKRPSQLSFFISKHTNIDDILGGSTQIWSPLMDRLYGYEGGRNEECTEIDAAQVIIHEGTPQRTVNQANILNKAGFPKPSAHTKVSNVWFFY
ncbi:dentin sialophosphoprotein-like, partial [Anoplophora glabripennis]|uniref:dentin sialophosphoprotein-like n=1 Tax=Anoplophora glabripennis TaxID=217634 RepID=UPI000875346B